MASRKPKLPKQNKHHKPTCTCNPCALAKMQWLSNRILAMEIAYKEDHEALEALRQVQESADNDIEALQDLIKQAGILKTDDELQSGGSPGGD